MIDGEVGGFASLKGADVIDMLYVDPDHAGEGVGATLLDALDKTRRRARREAPHRRSQRQSRNPCSRSQGFVAQQRNVVRVGDEWLANTTMSQGASPEAPKPQLQ